jgi:hypothetical protein
MTTIKKFMLLFSYMAIIAVAGQSCSPRVHTSLSWQPDPANVTEPDSWLPRAGYDAKSKLGYRLSNDHTNLYVLLQTDDEATKMKMLRGGMEVVIDTLGKTKGHCSLVFPIRQESLFSGSIPGRPSGGMPGGRHQGSSGDRPGRPARPEGAAGTRDADRAEMFQHLIGIQTHALINGFYDHREGRTRISHDNGIQVSLDLDTAGMLSYRAVIPIHSFYRLFLVEGDTGKVYGFKVHVSGLSLPQHAPGGIAGGRGNHSGRGYPGEGDQRGLPGTGGMPAGSRGVTVVRPVAHDMQNLSKDQIFKASFTLSSGQP